MMFVLVFFGTTENGKTDQLIAQYLTLTRMSNDAMCTGARMAADDRRGMKGRIGAIAANVKIILTRICAVLVALRTMERILSSLATMPDTPTPWQRASNSRRSQRSETEGAKLEGGRRVPRSGAGRQKGDIRTNGFRIEDKYTDAASYTITVETLKKITREALHTPPGLLPQMRITFESHGEKWRMLREADYLWLLAQSDIP